MIARRVYLLPPGSKWLVSRGIAAGVIGTAAMPTTQELWAKFQASQTSETSASAGREGLRFGTAVWLMAAAPDGR